MRMPSQSSKLAAKGTTYGVQDGLVMRCALLVCVCVCVWVCVGVGVGVCVCWKGKGCLMSMHVKIVYALCVYVE